MRKWGDRVQRRRCAIRCGEAAAGGSGRRLQQVSRRRVGGRGRVTGGEWAMGGGRVRRR